MPFVKLDCNMLRSTLWFERLQREIFITALLMARPVYIEEPMPQLKVKHLEETGWSVPANSEIPYGFVDAAGVGIVRHAIVSNNDEEIEQGLDALEKLGEPEQSTRTSEFDGRRLVRVDGGYIVLNFGKYRERDYTAAERQRRYREKQKANSNTVTSTRNTVTSRHRNVTSRMQKQSTEADAEADSNAVPKEKSVLRVREKKKSSTTTSDFEWLADLSTDKAYQGIDVAREHAKAIRWCKENKRQLTRRTFINWLNRADRKLDGTAIKEEKFRDV